MAIVTIVIPTRDRAQLLPRAIASAQAQTYRSVEIVIVDDGSAQAVTPTPGTHHIRNEASRGVSAARNQGLAVATGEWIVFLDDDDELLPAFVDASLRHARGSKLPGPVSVLSTIEVVDEAGRRRDLRRPLTLTRGDSFFDADAGRPFFAFANSLFAPVAAVRAIGGWDERLRAWEVEDFFIRLSRVSSIDALDAILYRMHDHRAPHLAGSDDAMLAGALLTIETHANELAVHRGRRARYQAAVAMLYLRNGRVLDAIRAIGTSFRLQPRLPRRPIAWLAAAKAFAIHAGTVLAQDVTSLIDRF
jgi:glycosyltransferase involved in cell wall biosynthesis